MKGFIFGIVLSLAVDVDAALDHRRCSHRSSTPRKLVSAGERREIGRWLRRFLLDLVHCRTSRTTGEALF
jgi:hypothetical protein